MDITTFIYIFAAAFAGLIFLTFKMHREMKSFIAELEFFLNQRTIAHNQSKAKLSVLQSKFDKLKEEKEQLRFDIASLKEGEKQLKNIIDDKNQQIKELIQANQELTDKNTRLKETVVNLKENSVFGGLLAEAEFIEARNTQIKKLGAEISSIQEVLNGDFKTKLTQYLNEVDGLNQRLNQAREEYYNKVKQGSLEGLDLDEL